MVRVGPTDHRSIEARDKHARADQRLVDGGRGICQVWRTGGDAWLLGRRADLAWRWTLR